MSMGSFLIFPSVSGRYRIARAPAIVLNGVDESRAQNEIGLYIYAYDPWSGTIFVSYIVHHRPLTHNNFRTVPH